jgi:hypothetical protein
MVSSLSHLRGSVVSYRSQRGCLVADEPVLLKVLLRQRHLQGHAAFRKEYDKVAASIDKDLVGSCPGKAQFYRWLSGDLVGLPYGHHCRVLEKMFPDWTAEQLFQPYNSAIDFVPEPSPTPRPPTTASSPPSASNRAVADLVAAYASRSDFMHAMPPRQLFDSAKHIRMVGLSLNLLCQHYPDRALLALLEGGSTIDTLFLDPDGQSIAQRDREEAHAPGTLATLTRLNIDTLRMIAGKLSSDAKNNLRIRTYDETIRFNITIIDDAVCIVQPYLPDARGVESPTLVMRRDANPVGLFDTFAQVFTSMWDRAKEVGT